jgi:hypothetical protein
LKQKHTNAISSKDNTARIVQEMDIITQPELREKWLAQEQKALTLRGENLRIYDICMNQGL